MNQFETLASLEMPCDICGSHMIVLHGGGWDYDIIYCSDWRECGAEITFPTTTEYKEKKENVK